MSPLPVTSSLAECEAVIERGLQTFVDVGQALLRIRDERLYRESHGRFEDYCLERWGLSKPYASQLIVASETVAIATTDVLPAPQTESVARELAPLRDEPELLREAWTEAVERFGAKPTAAPVDLDKFDRRAAAHLTENDPFEDDDVAAFAEIGIDWTRNAPSSTPMRAFDPAPHTYPRRPARGSANRLHRGF